MKRRLLLFNLFISLVLICGFMFYPSTANAAELPPKIGVGMFTDNTCIYADEMCTQLVAQCGTSEKGWRGRKDALPGWRRPLRSRLGEAGA